MDKMDKSLSEVFGIPEGRDTENDVPIEGEVLDVESEVNEVAHPSPAIISEDAEIDKDFLEVKNNIQEIIKKGSNALDDIILIGSRSEEPRAYEVVNQILGTLVDANKKLADLHLQKKKAKGTDKKSESGISPISATNAIFVGSTAELGKLIKEKEKEV